MTGPDPTLAPRRLDPRYRLPGDFAACAPEDELPEYDFAAIKARVAEHIAAVKELQRRVEAGEFGDCGGLAL